MLGDRGHRTGLNIGRRAHLERDLLIEHVLREVSERLSAVLVLLNVLDHCDAMTDPVGAADLHRLPDRVAAVCLAGMDRVVGVVTPQQLKGLQEARRWVALFRAGDIETDDAVAPIPQCQLRDIACRLSLPHCGDQLAYLDLSPTSSAGRHALSQAITNSLDRLRLRSIRRSDAALAPSGSRRR